MDISQLESIAKLSRLELNDEEKKEYLHDINNLLNNLLDNLNEINTDSVLPTFSKPKTISELRKDIQIKSLSNDSLLKNAPEKEDGAYLVPSVIE